MKYGLSGEDIINYMSHVLNGETLQVTITKERLPTGEVTENPHYDWAKTGVPFLNNKGIQAITVVMYSMLNRNTYLSNMEVQKAMDLSRQLLLSINKKLFLSTCYNRNEYDLRPDNYELILSQLTNILVSAILRPVDEGERKFYSKVTQEVRQVIDSSRGDSQQNSSGFFGK